MINATLCYIIKGGKVLLIRKKRGIGAGKYNGPGGKIEAGETPEQGVKREVLEEIGISPLDPAVVGEINFYFDKNERESWKVFIFKSRDFKGKEMETSEATPIWFPADAIPYDKMWASDRVWMPMVIGGKKIRGDVFFNETGEKLLSHMIEEID